MEREREGGKVVGASGTLWCVNVESDLRANPSLYFTRSHVRSTSS